MPTVIPMMEAGTQILSPQITQTQGKIQSVPTEQPKEEKKAETKPSTTTEEPKIEADTPQQDAVRIASLIRKEKQNLKRMREIQEREKKLAERESSLKPWAEAAEIAAQNKLEALKKLGISYDELTQQVLNGGNLPPEVVAKQSAAEIAKQAVAEFRKEFEQQQLDAQQRNYQSSIAMINAEAQRIVDASDKFPLVKNAKAYQDITREFEQEYYRTGGLRSVEEVAQRVEQEAEEGLAELLGIDVAQIQAMLRKEIAPESPKQSVPTPEPTQRITTLTNRAAVNPPSGMAESEAERRKRAIEAFYGRS
jgi:hypothetical protein